MKKITAKNVIVPLDVPKSKKAEYKKNYLAITKNSGKLMLFAGDQKIEHLNYDFYGKGISKDDATPEHLFKIASKGKIGVFASQLGLVARYGMDYNKVPYLIKLNSKTNLVPTKQKEPLSELLTDVDQVAEFKKNSGLNILGIGYTMYLGSENEAEMLRTASQVIYEAHQYGLIAVIWIYPRGKAVKNEKDSRLIAGATGTAGCIGADFVKVSYPGKGFTEATMAAGRSGVVCAGGSKTTPKKFLQTLKKQLSEGAMGNATGRNIHQKDLKEAVKFCNAIYAVTVEGKTVDQAMKILKK